MGTKVILLRSQDIFSDSRVLKYESLLKKENIPYAIVGWDRKGLNLKRENTFFYKRRAGFQEGEKAIVNRVWWTFFLFRFLFMHLKEYQIIHACDFDTVLPSLVMRILGKKVFFDIFDWFSDEVKTGKSWIDKPINLLEKFAVRHSNLVILCEKGRLRQIQCTPKNYIVIPNVPSQLLGQINSTKIVKENVSWPIVIAYVGGIVHSRGLLELVDCISGDDRFVLKIAGFGDSIIENTIKAAAQKYMNINFHGKVSYDRALEIMRESDILYAMYYKDNANHIYAAPNKFYESIYLNKPVITTEGTLVGNMVKQYRNGFVISEGKQALSDFLNSLTLQSIYMKKQDMGKTKDWEKKIQNCFSQYIKAIND